MIHTPVQQDFRAVTELPDHALNTEQQIRMGHRYHLAARLAQGKRVLEVACGAGPGLGLLDQQARQLVAVDYSFSVLRIAQAHYAARYPLICADASCLSLADGAFDLLLCFEAIYYLPDYTHFLRESRRLLGSDGGLLLSLSNPDWPYFAPGLLTTHYPGVPELAAALADAGFPSVRFFGILPTAAATPGARLRHYLRRAVLRVNPSLASGAFARQINRLLYRDLRPLPPELTSQTAADLATRGTVTPLPPDRPDRVHRVIYAFAAADAEGWAQLSQQ